MVNGKEFDMNSETESRIQAIIPDVALAVESLESATPDRVYSRLEEKNIRATRGETEMALIYGCKLGVIREMRRYRLSAGLRHLLVDNNRAQAKLEKTENAENMKMEDEKGNEDCKSNSNELNDDELEYDDYSDKESDSEASDTRQCTGRCEQNSTQVCEDLDDEDSYSENETEDT